MADLKRWFKVWTTILEDPHFQELSLDDIGRWVLLGAMTASVGSAGRLDVPGGGRRLCEALRLPDLKAVKSMIEGLPSVLFEEGTNRDGGSSVTWKNWYTFQKDSTAAERMKTLRSKRRGEQEEKKKRKKIPPPSPSRGEEGADWGDPAAFINVWNEATPDECPAVEELSEGRRQKIRAALKQFPAREYWQTVMAEYHRSKFLRGLTPKRPGHESFQADLDWLLQKGKDGVENFVKVREGKYRD